MGYSRHLQQEEVDAVRGRLMSWKRKSGSSKKPIAASGALLRCAIDTGSVERLAISGWIDGGGLGQWVWRVERVAPGIAHGLHRVRWSRRFSKFDVSTRTSGRRRSGGTWRQTGRSWRCPRDRRCTTSWCVTIWCRGVDGGCAGGIRVDRIPTHQSRTERGRPTSKASSRWATGSCATRSQCRTCIQGS